MTENTTSTLPVPVSQAPSIRTNGKRFSLKERIMIGLIFLSGILDAEYIAQYFGCTPQYVRKLGHYADTFFDNLSESVYPTFTLSPLFIERVCIALSVYCQASLEDISRTIMVLFNYHVSVEKVRYIRKKYAVAAKSFNDSISLKDIWVACSDEIFFGQTPVFASVDPYSTFILDIAIMANRKAETWQNFMLTLFNRQGLKLRLSISDGGSGLLRGIKDAFNKCFIQKDVFHNLMELGKPLYGLETSTFGFLTELYDKREAVKGPRPRQKTIEQLAQMEKECDAKLERVDNLFICYGWIKELLGFAHYTKEDTFKEITWCIEAMRKEAQGLNRITHALDVFERRLEESLSYLDFMYLMMDSLALDLGIGSDVLRLMYLCGGYHRDPKYKYMSKHIDKVLGSRRAEVQAALDDLITKIVRCSSIVENVNSRLRTALNDYRGMNDDLLELLQLRYNTTEYRRSNVPERVGKSPLELYCGDTRRLFDILMPEWEWPA